VSEWRSGKNLPKAQGLVLGCVGKKKTFQSRKQYYGPSEQYRALRSTSLKKVFIVRYADDFKLFCKTRSEAERIFIAVQKWLMERLGLEISPEKSKIVNLKKQWSDFLGFKLKLRPKSGKWVVKSQMTEKAFLKCKDTIREAIRRIGRNPSTPNVMQFNATVLGLHNYYKVATYVYTDFLRQGVIAPWRRTEGRFTMNQPEGPTLRESLEQRKSLRETVH
jgi:hypothetical protein